MFDWILQGSEGYVMPTVHRKKRDSITRWCKEMWLLAKRKIDVY